MAAPDFGDPDFLWSVLVQRTGDVCPFCGKADWITEGVIDEPVRPTAGARIIEVPSLLVACRVCGFQRSHTLRAIRHLHETAM